MSTATALAAALPAERRRPMPQSIVIFGASGDLTRRKLLPAFYHLFLDGLLPERFAIVGYARTELSDEEFREHAYDSVHAFGQGRPPQGEPWAAFAKHLRYVPGEFADSGSMDHVVDDLADVDEEHGIGGSRFFYAATPPSVYPDILARIAETGLAKDARIVLEKPFGTDLASAAALNAAVHEVFDESQVFRIDHYLGKETVQNILALRFANGLFEPIWNRRYIDHVQITVAESIGVEGRGAFYEGTGAIRDIVSTHLFQMMTFLAMEPPVSLAPDRLRDETVKVLRSTNVCDPAHVVRGQYEGYRDEEGVPSDSSTETYAALALEIDNWRWSDVPFFLRSGKRLARKLTEITLKFNKVPFNVFRGTDVDLPQRDHLTLRIQPDEGITLAFNAKKPGPGLDLDRATMEFDYDQGFSGGLADAYELLLVGAMQGDHTLFLRQDGVERAWEVLDPIVGLPGEPIPYAPGSWGPAEAKALIAPRRWHVSGEED